MDHLQMVDKMIQTSNEYQIPFIPGIFDFEKAFDSVNIAALEAAFKIFRLEDQPLDINPQYVENLWFADGVLIP
ncbi:unnamed protein product [Soboliphyme baturini]|uniref:Reverse transcriptase domain-containing protein n=1 Tax=Soboliphyme baturini TaxID=241478 RepID=A0A183J1N7_9BILA|nr:unnamed protein product [Soboliphyme baturini]